MSYTGTLVKDLQSLVEARLPLNGRICAVCGQRYGDHSFAGAYCPDSASAGRLYLQTSFTEQRCDAQVAQGSSKPLNCGAEGNG